jgi:hypothetical protein
MRCHCEGHKVNAVQGNNFCFFWESCETQCSPPGIFGVRSGKFIHILSGTDTMDPVAAKVPGDFVSPHRESAEIMWGKKAHFRQTRNQCTIVFFYLVGWDLTPIRSLCRSPRFVYVPVLRPHIGLLYIFPGWYMRVRINWWSERRLQGKLKYSEKTCPAPLCPTTNPTCLGSVSNPGPQR